MWLNITSPAVGFGPRDYYSYWPAEFTVPVHRDGAAWVAASDFVDLAANREETWVVITGRRIGMRWCAAESICAHGADAGAANVVV